MRHADSASFFRVYELEGLSFSASWPPLLERGELAFGYQNIQRDRCSELDLVDIVAHDRLGPRLAILSGLSRF